MQQKQADSKPSFARWWRQVLYVPMLHSKWLTKELQQRLTNKVTLAEQGHRGEVFLIIEHQLPIQSAYHHDCRHRALELFSQYRVWDTEENTGVLVYINICEHDLEIIADRGISAHVSPTVWQAMCDKALSGLTQDKIEESLSELLEEIGRLLRQYYYLENDPAGNELSDEVIVI
ncbi:TPM domain-containing protein [Psychrobacter sp. I-STPA10]|uniref:TPM domain-containing protein n=1 Tax=Psychrobacter sp. I-STPA10 TaxID=2585769 RepID=UPI001E5DD14C|nr:TPM domain-containing protein [Psychrobacter sp. I-STPA10]